MCNGVVSTSTATPRLGNVLRLRAPVTHWTPPRDYQPACGRKLDADDELSAEVRDVTCAACLRAMPWPSAA